MEWADITRYIGICLYAILAISFVIDWRKKSPQDYSNKQLLRIEIWTLLILVLSLMNQITFVIAIM